MNIPIIDAVAGVFRDLIGVADQLVEDKDKKNELIFKMMELQNNLNLQILQMKTTPWVDATVKILFAVQNLIIPMMRPFVATAMAGFAAYCAMNNITLNPVLEAACAAAFPGWMYSRHTEKKGK